ncbi:MAG: tRNA (N6-threonylcarbamoyladenosine(37)-N6)-methyltransferase TrmO [Bacteroidales bacterium]|nr:tRNA (N6-threonylcarbamoyladenosine(37)-N6)-methyltransferase TrmO [Bacteroidales bacterium]
MEQIAHIETPFKEKFGVPRQAGLVDYEARVVFEPGYRVPEAVRGLEEFDYIWLIWHFHANPQTWSPTVRPPRLGGNKRVGVFASRSPFRPNPIGLSSVRLLRIEPGPVLVVSGADLVDGTPIFDIKPYVAYADSHPDARCGFAPEAPKRLAVEIAPEVAATLPKEKLQLIADAIACDPRPHYQHDPERIYKMKYDDYEVAFRVDEGKAFVECLIV